MRLGIFFQMKVWNVYHQRCLINVNQRFTFVLKYGSLSVAYLWKTLVHNTDVNRKKTTTFYDDTRFLSLIYAQPLCFFFLHLILVHSVFYSVEANMQHMFLQCFRCLKVTNSKIYKKTIGTRGMEIYHTLYLISYVYLCQLLGFASHCSYRTTENFTLDIKLFHLISTS